MVRFGAAAAIPAATAFSLQDRSRWTTLSSLPDSGVPSDPHQAEAEADAGRKLLRVVVQVSGMQGYLPGGSSQAVLWRDRHDSLVNGALCARRPGAVLC